MANKKVDFRLVEDNCYQELSQVSTHIFDAAHYFQIDTRILVAVLYVEKLYHKEKHFFPILKSWKNKITDVLARAGYYSYIKMFPVSMGYGQVRHSAARAAKLFFGDCFNMSNIDIEDFPKSDYKGIFVSAMVLRALHDYWLPVYPIIAKEPAIWGTLYNINKSILHPVPHTHPESGGSITEFVCDGKFYESLDFGQRTSLAYYSSSLQQFISTY